jgi:hypothetical protein
VPSRDREPVARSLIPVPAFAGATGPAPRRTCLLHVLLIAAVTALTYAATLRNGFLLFGFDDALITDSDVIRRLDAAHVRRAFTGFNEAPYYMPITLVSLAIDHRFWGLDPLGYHLGNVVLHVATAVLAYAFLLPLVGVPRLALLAALLFAVHPVQMESVSVAVQRKTVLAGVFFFLTFILYQAWRRGNRRWCYAAALMAFAVAALAKPAVVALPLLLVLYDYTFARERMRLRATLPFFACAAVIALLTVRAHAALGALHPPHGGSWFSNLLMVSRVLVEYADALFLPINLSPIYYYPTAVAYSPLNFLALAAVVTTAVLVTRCRRRFPWSFFCFWWFLLVMLPEANLVPLAQLRADRYLYFAVLPFGLWVVVGLARLDEVWNRDRALASRVLGPIAVGSLAVLCYGSAGVWRDDVSAWSRVVERHPWCGVAYSALGEAYYEGGDKGRAEAALLEAFRRAARDPQAHLYLARIYAESGRRVLARTEVEEFLRQAPGDAAGRQLLATLTQADS